MSKMAQPKLSCQQTLAYNLAYDSNIVCSSLRWKRTCAKSVRIVGHQGLGFGHAQRQPSEHKVLKETIRKIRVATGTSTLP